MLTDTPPRMYRSMLASWNERHPSSIVSVPLPLLISLGLTKIHSRPFPFSPSGLYTINRMLTPTCGAAKPTPSSLHAMSAKQLAYKWLLLTEQRPSRRISLQATSKDMSVKCWGGTCIKSHSAYHLYIISNISAASCLRDSSKTAILAFFALSRGSGYRTMSSGDSHSNLETAVRMQKGQHVRRSCVLQTNNTHAWLYRPEGIEPSSSSSFISALPLANSLNIKLLRACATVDRRFACRAKFRCIEYAFPEGADVALRWPLRNGTQQSWRMCCRGSCLIVGRTSKQVQVMGVAFCDDDSVERWQSWSKSGRPLMSWLSQVAETRDWLTPLPDPNDPNAWSQWSQCFKAIMTPNSSYHFQLVLLIAALSIWLLIHSIKKDEKSGPLLFQSQVRQHCQEWLGVSPTSDPYRSFLHVIPASHLDSDITPPSVLIHAHLHPRVLGRQPTMDSMMSQDA